MKISWTDQAKEALESILEYRYSKKPQAYKIVRDDIINSTKKIFYKDQYQQDDINPEYRRIIIRDYKVLYKEHKGDIFIMNVVCTKGETG